MPQRTYLVGGIAPPFRAIDIDTFFDYLKNQDGIGGDITSAQAAFARVAWVYRCTNMRAQTVGGMPWTIKRDGNDVDWPLARHLPGLLARIEYALCLRGASYVLKQANRWGIKGLQWLNPWSVRANIDSMRGIVGFEQNVNGVPRVFQPDDIIYHTTFNPNDDLGPGIPPAEVALRAAGMAANANELVAQFFAHGAVPAVLLTTDQLVPDEELERIKTVWDRLFGGVRKAFRTAALRYGLKPQVIGSPLKDLVIAPLLAEARSQIAVAFGIPQTMIEDAANFATAREHRLSFYYETIFPECDQIAAGLNDQLFRPLGLEFGFDYNSVEAVQQDETTKAQSIVQLLRANIITVDEARKALGYEPMGQATALPAAGGGSSAVVGESTTMAEGAELSPMVGLSDEAIHDLARWRRNVQRGRLQFQSAHIPAWLHEAIRWRIEQGWRSGALDPCTRAWDRGGAERKLARRLIGVLDEGRQAIGKDVANGKVPNLTNLLNDLASVLTAEITRVVADALLAEAVEIGAGIEYAKAVTDAARWAKENAGKLVKKIDSETTDLVRQVVAQVADGTLSGDDAVAMLVPHFGEARAQMIAATETTRAQQQAKEIYRSELEARGLRVHMRWLAAEDERMCEICASLDHTLEDIWRLQFPEGPPAHPNCRCVTVIEVAA